MLRLISDADVHGHIVTGLRGRHPAIDLVRVQEVGLRTAQDPVILQWAAAENRIVITQDHSTMIGFARARLLAGLPMAGLFVLRQRTTIGQAIDALLLVDQCSEQHEWQNRIEFLPL
jgi:predicted nuclease of predicted toxin-antitoxin system